MLSTRPTTDQDEAFLCALYGSTREQEMALVDWTPEQKDEFIRMQFQARSRSYAASFPHAERSIAVADGIDVGAWILDRRSAEIRVVDVAILPAHRGQGFGTELMNRVLGEAFSSGREVSLSVDRQSPAQRLYERLGFAVENQEDPVRLELRWVPRVNAQAAEAAP